MGLLQNLGFFNARKHTQIGQALVLFQNQFYTFSIVRGRKGRRRRKRRRRQQQQMNSSKTVLFLTTNN